MTVAELRDFLARCPSDAKVYIGDAHVFGVQARIVGEDVDEPYVAIKPSSFFRRSFSADLHAEMEHWTEQ